MFPGAVADRNEAAYALVGAPLDVSTTFQPGTRFGPRLLSHVAEAFSDYDHHTSQRFTNLSVHDHGPVRPGDDAEEYLHFLEGTVRDYCEEDTVPVVLGGEHTVSLAGFRGVEPDTYICLDAHLDLRESYAGNPLNHATVTHHALDVVDEVVLLGARAGSEDGWSRVEMDDRITVIPPQEVPAWTPSLDSDDVYLSVDIDAADPGFAPGTGTPEPFGLEPQTMHKVLREVAPHCAGFDIVEVNDRDNGQAATLAAKLLRAFVFAHADSN
ncbi:arginase family protein [Halovenus rubra]|uniref:Arginase family protein n=2 Tax=Halovenus rubra TaxID=869890 RepID=A0ABD5X1Y5_9EURY|nr:arginase family protein [Halovenus rubra]